MDPEKHRLRFNNGPWWTIDDLISRGSYNIMMADSPLYDADSMTREASHKEFKTALSQGFAWEVLEVFSGVYTSCFKYVIIFLQHICLKY